MMNLRAEIDNIVTSYMLNKRGVCDDSKVVRSEYHKAARGFFDLWQRQLQDYRQTQPNVDAQSCVSILNAWNAMVLNQSRSDRGRRFLTVLTFAVNTPSHLTPVCCVRRVFSNSEDFLRRLLV